MSVCSETTKDKALALTPAIYSDQSADYTKMDLE